MTAINSMTVTTELTKINCGECGGVYAISERYRQQKEDVNGMWHCPYCKCGWGYFGDTAVQKLRKQLTREIASHDQTRTNLQHTERQRRAEKAAKTRIKNRIKNGVCPCCNRSFQNLHQHMKSQHPDYSTGS